VGSTEGSSEEAGQAAKKPNVLLVEDEHDVRSVFVETLQRAGYQVVACEDLNSARAVVAHPREAFDAAVVDYRLPDGTALELVQMLIDAEPMCRSVVVTGEGDARIANESARYGAHVYLQKPVSIQTLLEAVRDTVKSTSEWRNVLQRANQPTRRASTTPLRNAPLDIDEAVARLKQIGRLSRIDTITAWRMLWGDTNREIAQVLGCTERTAKFHVAEVLSRTGARSRTGLLRVLLEDAGVEDPWLRRRAGSDNSEAEASPDDQVAQAGQRRTGAAR
jgi:DNA-binding NarL/FixJ family response regulator